MKDVEADALPAWPDHDRECLTRPRAFRTLEECDKFIVTAPDRRFLLSFDRPPRFFHTKPASLPPARPHPIERSSWAVIVVVVSSSLPVSHRPCPSSPICHLQPLSAFRSQRMWQRPAHGTNELTPNTDCGRFHCQHVP